MRFAQFLLIVAVALFFPIQSSAVPRDITAQWEYPAIEGIVGFRLYQEDTLVCSTNDSQATSLRCTVDIPDGPSWFTITAVFGDEVESSHSDPLSYIFSSGLKAYITADIVEGEGPLPVTFDATTSTGDIVSHEWMFGDGDTGNGDRVSHTFTAAGSYTVTLKITDAIGAYDQEYLTVVVTDPVTLNSPPIAVVSSSASVGNAPLPVLFDGSDSSDNDGIIAAYGWALGDGATADSPQVNHTYVSGGTFHAQLTVTDNGGLNDSVSTPVIVLSSGNGNISPIAGISASHKRGKVPLVVTLSGKKSYDPDGSISAYTWSFGDGSSGSGLTVQHTFNLAASYSVTLRVTDDKGAVSLPARYKIYARASDEYDTNTASQVIVNFLLLKSSPVDDSVNP